VPTTTVLMQQTEELQTNKPPHFRGGGVDRDSAVVTFTRGGKACFLQQRFGGDPIAH